MTCLLYELCSLFVIAGREQSIKRNALNSNGSERRTCLSRIVTQTEILSFGLTGRSI